VTTWQLLKVPVFHELGRKHPGVLILLALPLALLFYYLNRKYIIWCDPVKEKARRKGFSMYFPRRR
jgi:hypothetical protein